jgi:hypothetical protein
MSKVYVYDGKEVVLTGRKAEKKLRTKVDQLVEIKPKDISSTSSDFCKWVRLVDLYEIVEDE